MKEKSAEYIANEIFNKWKLHVKFSCGVPAKHETLLGRIEEALTQAHLEGRRELKSVLNRLKLEFDANVCQCGEKWSEADAYYIIIEVLRSIENSEINK